MNFLLLLLILLIGIAMPAEAAMNARLRESLQSPTLGTLVSFAVGLATTGLLLGAGVLGVPKAPLSAWRGASWCWWGLLMTMKK